MKKYITRNNSGVGSSSSVYRKRAISRGVGGRKKGTLFDLVDTLGTVVISYEDKDVPTSGELDHVVHSLEVQADRYNNHRYGNHHSSHSNHDDDYDYDYNDNDDINDDHGAGAGVSKNTRLKSGKLPSRAHKNDFIYEKENTMNDTDDKANKRTRYDRYDRQLINDTITHREKERARERDAGKNNTGDAPRGGSSNDTGSKHAPPQYTLNSEKVYAIFDAIIRTYGEYSREVGTTFVDTALKLTNRQIDSLACVKMLQTLFRDSPEVVHLFFDLLQSEPGTDNVDHGVDFTKNLSVDERLLFGQKHEQRHKPHLPKYPPPHAQQQPPAQHQTAPLYHQPLQINSQQARERHEVVQFLNEVKSELDFVTYQRFQDYMLEVRVIYKDQRYHLLEMKMNQVVSLLGNRNDLKVQLERLFPVNKIAHRYQHEYNPQMHMLGYDQMRMGPGHMPYPGAQFPPELQTHASLGHHLYPPPHMSAHMSMGYMMPMGYPGQMPQQGMPMPQQGMPTMMHQLEYVNK